jgi:hypothetical protein
MMGESWGSMISLRFGPDREVQHSGKTRLDKEADFQGNLCISCIATSLQEFKQCAILQ